MDRRLFLFVALALALTAFPRGAFAQASGGSEPQGRVIDLPARAAASFGGDASWYLNNIPFLEIDDPAIQRTYDYRWQLYRAHLREIGVQGTDETEFLPSVPWARHPYEDLNDSASFHILEGRWLRNPVYVTSLVDHLYAGAGNDRHFSESIAAATLGWVKVTGNATPALQHLDTMQHVYNLWDDHFDAARNLYWIEPLLDATEYTISSIDASGAEFTERPKPHDNGFTGGFAFRPSINAYQFGNADAIAAFARLAGKPALADEYAGRAERLRSATLQQLWNPALQQFTDVYQRSTAFVTAGTFVRGRELVGFVPWQFELPPRDSATASPGYGAAWKHALSSGELSGAYGLRTAEPTYPRYLTQYRYDAATGQPECQWNGPSWPFQTSQVLSAMANLLQDYPAAGVTASDYVHLLRQYTRQHEIAPGKLDLQEDYNPDTGKPIVGLPRSHHYNHSTYNDLVLSGLLGIRPRLDDVFELDPLLPPPGASEPAIRYFALEKLSYHGHDMTVVYDADGRRYHLGAGLTVFADGVRVLGPVPLGHVQVRLAPAAARVAEMPVVDLAVNVWGRMPSPFETELPIASASSTEAGTNLYEAIDGREWFFPEVPHGWSPVAALKTSRDDAQQIPVETWYAVDLRRKMEVSEVVLAFFADGQGYKLPVQVRVQAWRDDTWTDVTLSEPAALIGNGETHLRFSTPAARKLRVLFEEPGDGSNIRLVSLAVHGSRMAARN